MCQWFTSVTYLRKERRQSVRLIKEWTGLKSRTSRCRGLKECLSCLMVFPIWLWKSQFLSNCFTDLLKMDLNGLGHPLLYFGIAENPSELSTPPAIPPVRPTSYLPALHQCQTQREDLAVEVSNELEPLIPHARVAGSTSSAGNAQRDVLLLPTLILAGVTYYRFWKKEGNNIYNNIFF